MHDVSVIIINYNTFDLTCNCIRSVIANTKCNYEIIVVDNASAECDASLFLKEFPGIKLVQSKTNLGFAKGNNLGIENADGEYILLLNSDTVLLNPAIDLSLERIKRDPGIGALSSQLVSEDGSLQNASNEFVTIRKNIARTFRLQKFIPGYQFKKNDLKLEHETEWIWGTFFLFSRKALASFKESKLPDDFFMYGEDRQWCYILRRSGFRILYYPEAKIKHLIGASSSDKEHDRFIKYFLPNEYKMYKLEDGKAYAILFFLSSGIFFLSSFKPAVIKKGFQYIKVAFNGLIGAI